MSNSAGLNPATNTLTDAAAGYPDGAAPKAAASANVAAAVATATISPGAGKYAYLHGFEVQGSGATAASVVNVTVAGLIGGVTMTFPLAVPAGVTAQHGGLAKRFTPPLQSALGTDIVVSCPSLGAGSTNNAVAAFGYVK